MMDCSGVGSFKVESQVPVLPLLCCISTVCCFPTLTSRSQCSICMSNAMTQPKVILKGPCEEISMLSAGPLQRCTDSRRV
jgi:hypothetical protein